MPSIKHVWSISSRRGKSSGRYGRTWSTNTLYERGIGDVACYVSTVAFRLRLGSLRIATVLDRAAAFLAAIFADAVNLEVVARGVKMVFASDLFFQLVHLRREKLDRCVALRADHVMVVAAIELMFIARHAVRERDSAGQATLCQKFEGTVNRGETDLGVFLADQAEKLVGREMIARLKKSAQDSIALVSMFQPHALQVLKKDFLRLAHGFARRRRMIVNPSLQHVLSRSSKNSK